MEKTNNLLHMANSFYKSRQYGSALATYREFIKRNNEIAWIVDANIQIALKKWKYDFSDDIHKIYVHFKPYSMQHVPFDIVLSLIEAGSQYDINVFDLETKDNCFEYIMIINSHKLLNKEERGECFSEVFSYATKKISALINKIRKNTLNTIEHSNKMPIEDFAYLAVDNIFYLKKSHTTIIYEGICLTLLNKKNRKKDIKYSVIIPVFNNENSIAKAIESVLMQNYEIEIIIYNDSSTDRTENILDLYYHKYSNITIISSDVNMGQGFGRNVALTFAEGEYITFLDSDDYYHHADYFKKIGNITTEKGNPDIIVTPYYRKTGNKIRKDSFLVGEFDGLSGLQVFIDRRFGTHGPGAKFFKRDILTADVKFVECGYSQDVLFSFYAFKKAKKVCSIDIPSYTYNYAGISSWRPVRLTSKHAYSSVRLFYEMLLAQFKLKLENIDISLEAFIATWRKDHIPRLESYMAYNKDKGDLFSNAITLIGEFINMLPLNAQLNHVFSTLYDLQRMNLITNDKNENRFVDLIKTLYNEISIVIEATSKEESRDIIVIYVSHLSSGGLEKVAAQLGTVLCRDYKVIYLLDKIDKIHYTHDGVVHKCDLMDLNVLEILHKASYIFDFKYKNSDYEHPACAYMIKKYSHKYICTVHNTQTCHHYFEKTNSYLDGNTPSSLYSIICVSNAVKEKFIGCYGDSKNLNVLYNPIDFVKIDASDDKCDICEDFILFVGRLRATQHKGIDLLFESFSKSKAIMSHKLILAGDGVLDNTILDFIHKNRMEDKIECIGFVKNIYPYMKKASFVFQPSRWEGFSLALIESIACGTPVLSSVAGGAREVIEHGYNGYLVNIDDINGMGEGINYMVENAYHMRKNCRTSVQKFSMDNYSANLSVLLNKKLSPSCVSY